MEDWRLFNQENYLFNRRIIRHNERLMDNSLSHEHCEFCFRKQLCEDDQAWYSTLDNYHWICSTCFHDFSGLLSLRIYNGILEEKSLIELICNELSQFNNMYPLKRVISILENIKPNSLNDTSIKISFYKEVNNGIVLFKTELFDRVSSTDILRIADTEGLLKYKTIISFERI